MKLRLLCLLIIIIIAVINCGGCAGGGAGLKTVDVNEADHTVFYAPFYVAIEKGYFKEAGIKINLVNMSGSDKVLASLQKGECKIALMGPETSIYSYRDGAQDYVVNFAQLTQRAGDFLVSRDLNEEFAWRNLLGKTVIGGRADSMPEMVFEYILKKHGIDPETDLKIIKDIEFGLTAKTFSAGQGDYTLEFTPAANTLEREGAGKIAASMGEESGRTPFTVFSAMKSYIDINPETIQKFTSALQKGFDYIAAHSPEEVAKMIIPQFSQMDRKDLAMIIKVYKEQNTWKDNLIFERGSYILIEDILTEAGQYKSEVPYASIVLTEYAQKAADNK